MPRQGLRGQLPRSGAFCGFCQARLQPYVAPLVAEFARVTLFAVTVCPAMRPGHGGEVWKAGKDPEPSAAIMDSQSVRIAEESGGNKGYDAGKNVPGRKRHLLVDTSGLLLAERVTPADTSDKRGAREMLAGLAPLLPRLKLVWADGAYAGEKLRGWCKKHTGWRLEVVPRDPGSCAFEVLPRRWVVERSIAWIGRNRRLAKDYERKVQTGECLMKVAMIRLMLKRLGRK